MSLSSMLVRVQCLENRGSLGRCRIVVSEMVKHEQASLTVGLLWLDKGLCSRELKIESLIMPPLEP